MNQESRKKNFVNLLREILETKCDGIQSHLAKKVKIKAASVSRWFTGQVDPINVETLIFSRLAMLKGCSTHELAQTLGFQQIEQDSKKKFRILLKNLLSDKTQTQLGELIGVSQIAISNWLNPDKDIDPARIPSGTMFAIAEELGWTFDNLLIHLGLQTENKQNTLAKYKSELSELSLSERKELSIWLSNSLKNEQDITFPKADYTVYIILEKEDLGLAAKYANHLGLYFEIPDVNITIKTISQINEIKEDFNLLVFDIETNSSNARELIKQISFNGDIVIFTSQDLEAEVRSQLEDKVTDIVAKPIDWNSLKDKPYFMDSESKGTN